MVKNPAESSSSQIIDYLKDLDHRVSKLESTMKSETGSRTLYPDNGQRERGDGKPKEFEIRIGEYWSAYLGIIILVLAFTLLLSFPWKGNHQSLPSIAGLVIVGGMVGSAKYFKSSYKFISLQLWGGAYFLSFLSILRIFHFSEQPLLSPGYLENTILTLLCFGLVAIAHQKRSIYLCSIGLTLVLMTGILINQPVWTFSLNALVSVAVVFYSRKLGSSNIFIYGSLMVYVAHFLGMLGNPLMTGSIETIANPILGLTFILIYAVILSLTIILPSSENTGIDYAISNALANGLPAFILFNLSFLIGPTTNPLILKMVFFIIFFGLALVFWNRLAVNFSMVLFTLFAHGTISIGFIQSVSAPNLHVILIWQSLLVLANALWFKSKFITVSNFLLYIILFLAYTAASGFAGIISVSFGFVALASARMIRAFEDRLAWSFDILINFYLAIAFFSLPFALWKALPSEWVAFAWLGVIIIYYYLSAKLISPRYRWMGHLTLIMTLCYVFLLATISLDPVYRILTFMVFGCVLITVSVIYTRIRKGKVAAIYSKDQR